MDYEQLLELVAKLGSMIAATFGNNCEVAISDLDSPDHAILYLFNGQVTGRNIGDPLDDWARSRIENSADGYLVNYHKFRNNKDLKASTLCFEAFGHHLSLCINYDISNLQLMQALIGQMVETSRMDLSPAQVPDSPLEDAIDQAIRSIGKPAGMLNKEERLQVITLLEKQGVLQMQKSIPSVAKMLGVSRYTVYNYLSELGFK